MVVILVIIAATADTAPNIATSGSVVGATASGADTTPIVPTVGSGDLPRQVVIGGSGALRCRTLECLGDAGDDRTHLLGRELEHADGAQAGRERLARCGRGRISVVGDVGVLGRLSRGAHVGDVGGARGALDADVVHPPRVLVDVCPQPAVLGDEPLHHLARRRLRPAVQRVADGEEVEDDVWPQPQVVDLQRGALELALLALRADKEDAHGRKGRTERGQPKVGGHRLDRLRADDRVAVQALAVSLVAVGHDLDDHMVAARLREHEALERRDVCVDAERGDATKPPKVSAGRKRVSWGVGRVEVVE